MSTIDYFTTSTTTPYWYWTTPSTNIPYTINESGAPYRDYSYVRSWEVGTATNYIYGDTATNYIYKVPVFTEDKNITEEQLLELLGGEE